GGLHVFGGQLCTVMELHTLAQEERVGLAVFADFPTMRQIGDYGLATVARVAADQIVEHACLGTEIVEGTGLMHIGMRRAVGEAQAQHAAGLCIWFGSLELEFAAVIFIRYFGSQTAA